MWTMNQGKKKTKKSWFKGPLWDLTGPEIFILDNYLLSISCELARYWEYRGKWFGLYSLYKCKDSDGGAEKWVQESRDVLAVQLVCVFHPPHLPSPVRDLGYISAVTPSYTS